MLFKPPHRPPCAADQIERLTLMRPEFGVGEQRGFQCLKQIVFALDAHCAERK